MNLVGRSLIRTLAILVLVVSFASIWLTCSTPCEKLTKKWKKQYCACFKGKKKKWCERGVVRSVDALKKSNPKFKDEVCKRALQAAKIVDGMEKCSK